MLLLLVVRGLRPGQCPPQLPVFEHALELAEHPRDLGGS